MTRRAAVPTVLILVAFAMGAQSVVDPYAVTPSDPYVVAVKSSPSAGGAYVVELTVTDAETGTVVYSPRVATRPGLPAELLSEHEGKVFETRISVRADGTATVTFEAYEKVLQRTRVSAKPQ